MHALLWTLVLIAVVIMGYFIIIHYEEILGFSFALSIFNAIPAGIAFFVVAFMQDSFPLMFGAVVCIAFGSFGWINAIKEKRIWSYLIFGILGDIAMGVVIIAILAFVRYVL